MASAFDPAQMLVEGLFSGRWVFASRSWHGETRIFHFASQANGAPLTRADRNIVALVARGASNCEIGYMLGGIQPSTVSTYLSSVSLRLRARAIDFVALGPLLE